MDVPNPPEDQELKNIIDKLANFVARNGPEFEYMTKNKQNNNPKFSFLFGGQYYNYYQYKVTSEQTVISGQKQELAVEQQKLVQQQAIVQQVITQQAIQTAPWQQTQPSQQSQQLSQQIQQLQQQIQQQQQQTQDQIKQSEQNLAAQYQSLIQQQQIQIEDAILKATDQQLKDMSIDCGVEIDDMDKVLQPIIESCTKDAISNGKTWILTRCIGDAQCGFMTEYLLKRITAREANFQMRLHLIYLVNDLLHHCQRKNAEELKEALEKIVVPAFCTASTGVEEIKKQKLTKLLSLWEQNKYFAQATIELMKDAAASLAAYQASLITDHAHIVTQITASVQQQYSQLQNQHQEYSSHLNNQIQTLQQQLQQLIQQQQAAETPILSTSLPVVLPQPGVVTPVLTQSGAIVAQPVVVQPTISQTTSTIQTTIQTTIPTAAALISSLISSFASSQPSTVVSTRTDALPVSSLLSQPIVVSTIPTLGTASPVTLTPPPATITATLTVPPPTTLSLPPPGSAIPITSHPPPGAAPPFTSQPPPSLAPGASMPPFPTSFSTPPPTSFSTPPPGFPPPFTRPPYDYSLAPRVPGMPPMPPNFSTPPPGMQLPDLSRPPPGFPMPGPPLPPPQEVDLLPSVPYFELPAGLMAPLVNLEDSEYKSLDPKDIRLPPPAPPSERLLAAVEAFYSLPSHERPRDSEGWEKLGLYEFFKAKQRAKKIRDREREANPNRREPSRSPSPEIRRSRSRSPPRRRRRYNSGRRSRSRSRSRSKSDSPLPYQRTSRSPSPVVQVQVRRKSRSPSPARPSFAEPMPTPGQITALGQDNKGHQLLMKMGWGGGGLGATEQGIVEPISGADVRDRQDKFKGVGVDMKDPFEQFRKNKSAGFIQRMRARDENIKEAGKKKAAEQKNGDEN